MAPYLCDALGVNLLELYQLDTEAVLMQLAYAEGKGLAEWANANEPGKGNASGNRQPND
jgi:hypothetical protein